MPKEYKTLQDFGRDYKESKAQEAENALSDSKNKIKTVIDERMDGLLPGYKIKSDLPGIDTISIIKNLQNDGFFVNFYPSPDRLNHFQLSIFRDGTLSGNIPGSFKFNHSDVYKEVFDVLDTVGLDFWFTEPQDILSVPDWPVTDKKEGDKPPTNVSEDRRRIEFFRKQPDALFGFTGTGGFTGYYGFMFDGFIVLEHPLCENAAYFIDFGKLSDEEIEKSKTYTGRKELMKKYWGPYNDRGKWDVFTSGADRAIHKPIDDWIPQMAEILNSRTPLPDRSVKFESARRVVP